MKKKLIILFSLIFAFLGVYFYINADVEGSTDSKEFSISGNDIADESNASSISGDYESLDNDSNLLYIYRHQDLSDPTFALKVARHTASKASSFSIDELIEILPKVKDDISYHTLLDTLSKKALAEGIIGVSKCYASGIEHAYFDGLVRDSIINNLGAYSALQLKEASTYYKGSQYYNKIVLQARKDIAHQLNLLYRDYVAELNQITNFLTININNDLKKRIESVYCDFMGSYKKSIWNQYAIKENKSDKLFLAIWSKRIPSRQYNQQLKQAYYEVFKKYNEKRNKLILANKLYQSNYMMKFYYRHSPFSPDMSAMRAVLKEKGFRNLSSSFGLSSKGFWYMAKHSQGYLREIMLGLTATLKTGDIAMKGIDFIRNKLTKDPHVFFLGTQRQYCLINMRLSMNESVKSNLRMMSSSNQKIVDTFIQ